MQSRITNYHLLAKPAGAACNLGCKYCFFLSKENLYGERESPMMSDAQQASCAVYCKPNTDPDGNWFRLYKQYPDALCKEIYS